MALKDIKWQFQKHILSLFLTSGPWPVERLLLPLPRNGKTTRLYSLYISTKPFSYIF